MKLINVLKHDLNRFFSEDFIVFLMTEYVVTFLNKTTDYDADRVIIFE